MTVIVNTIWGGRVSQVVDRQISVSQYDSVTVKDSLSTKVCVVLCSDALVSIAYTGIAKAHGQWMDHQIASRVSGQALSTAFLQVGRHLLARPLHTIIRQLAINLNGQLNTDPDPRIRIGDLHISIIGWHLGKYPKPLHWDLIRDPTVQDGRRYFSRIQQKVGKFLRQYPMGLWAETLGDHGDSVDEKMRILPTIDGYTHDDVERYVKDAIHARSIETETVSSECLAVQLDPLNSDFQVQFTRYPSIVEQSAPTFHTGWVLTPTTISSPSTQNTFGSTYSECGRYLIGGMSIGSPGLKIQTRLPAASAHHGGSSRIFHGAQPRAA
jgi:hypothetical protein